MHRLLLVEVANWKFVAILGALGFALLATAWRRRRHLLPLVSAALALVLLSGADAVNTYFGYLPQVADVVGVTDWPVVPARDVGVAQPTIVPAGLRRHGGVATVIVTGASSRFGRHHVLAYLPPEYFTEPGRRFPAVYLLHGSPGRPEDWLRANRLLSIASRTDRRPIIYVMPPVSRGWLDDSECVDGRREHVETWIVRDVVPQIDDQLRTIPDRADRGVAGNSAGGYCALNLALKHSDVFGAALDMSGYAEPTYDGGLRRLFGPSWRDDAARNTPAQVLSSVHVTLPFSLRFAVGGGDHRPLREAQALLPTLRQHGVTASVTTYPGTHTYHVWVPALRDGTRWLGELFYPSRRTSAFTRDEVSSPS